MVPSPGSNTLIDVRCSQLGLQLGNGCADRSAGDSGRKMIVELEHLIYPLSKDLLSFCYMH